MSDISAPGVRDRRFVLDTESERVAVALRSAALVLTLIGSVWLVALGPGVVGATVAVLGGLAAVGWMASTRRGRQRLQRKDQWYLELNRTGFTLAEGGRTLQVEWSMVTAVETDEDRLTTVVRLDRQSSVTLEPRYRGQSVYQLTNAVREHWRAAVSDP